MTAAAPLALRDGWCEGVRWVASPNWDLRPQDAEVDLLVIHSISLPPGRFGGGHIDALFLNALDLTADPYFASLAGLKVSAHFLIDQRGEITQYVATGHRAWHAGVSAFEGRPACNDYSLGIELEGCDEQPFSDAQYAQLQRLTAALLRVYPAISLHRIVGHADIAPGRKTDPGPGFDWARYRGAIGRLTAGLAPR